MASSRWTLRSSMSRFAIGYHGSLWLDGPTATAREIRLVADDLPAGLGVKSVERRLHYTRVRIGSSELVLPDRATLQTVDFNGEVTKTESRFHNCREYTARSSIDFNPPELVMGSEGSKPADSRFVLPDEFEVEAALEAELDSNVAAVGDLVRATVRRNLKRGRRFGVPIGSVLHGRISRLNLVNGFRYLDVAFEHLEVSGNRVRLDGRKTELERNVDQFRVSSPIRAEGARLRLEQGYRLLIRSMKRQG